MKTTTQGLSPRAARRGSAGFALIEVLVAVLLFAIGVLGIVGLQASMTKAQTESKTRADAANLVDELATLMWSDVGTDMANLVDYKAGSCAGNSHCGPWLAKMAAELPGGTLDALDFDETVTDTTLQAFGRVTVTLSWTLPSGVSPKYVATFNIAPAGS